jgi:hypothetical protein
VDVDPSVRALLELVAIRLELTQRRDLVGRDARLEALFRDGRRRQNATPSLAGTTDRRKRQNGS